MKKLLFVVLLVFLAGVVSTPAFAQSGYAEITGIVTDPSGALISGATVILSNNSTGENRSMTTNTAGTYRFTAVAVGGQYSISVAAQGFSKYQVANLQVSVGAVLTQDIRLSVGSTQATVLVNGSSEPDIQLSTSSVSQLIDENIWKAEPLETRTQNAFVTLTAGANPDNGTGRGAAVDGARTGSGNFMADGYDNNDQSLGGGAANFGGGAVVTISPDALQEYRVMSHDNPAEYGKAGGFATDTVMKSGTNQWHGSLFEYNRIQALAAQHFMNGFAGNTLKDSLVRNQFGGSVGGPIWKDKTFFFAALELHRMRTGSPLTTTATTADFVNFVSSGAFAKFNESDPNGLCMQYNGAPCPGGFSHSASLGPVFQKLYAAEKHNFPYATNTFTNAGQGWYSNGAVTYPVNVYGNVSVTQGASTDQERASFRFDHKISDNDSLAATYLIDKSDNTTEFAGGGTTIGPDELTPTDAQLFGVTWTHIFNPTLTNQARASYLRHFSNFTSPDTAGVPQIVTNNDPLGVGFGAYSGFPQPFTENQFQYQEHLTKVAGKHTLSMGGEFRRTRNGSKFYNDVYGTFSPYDVETLLTDGAYGDDADMAVFGASTYGGFYSASAAIDSTDNAAPNPYRGYRANETAFYAQDDWRVNSRFTMNLGLRWEYFGPPHNVIPNIDSNVYWGSGYAPLSSGQLDGAGKPIAAVGNPLFPVNSLAMARVATATFQIRNHNLWNKDLNNFGPRFGFAWDLTGRAKYVLRGGASIGYDRIYNNAFENIRFNPPHYSDNTIGATVNGVPVGPAEQPGLYSANFTGNAAFATYGGKPVPRHMDQDLVTPYYEGAHLGIETALGHDYTLETNYVGTLGRKLLGLRDVNNYNGRTSCPASAPSAACVAAGYPKGFTSARPNSLFNGDNFRTNGFLSNYHALQVSLKKHYTNGLQFTANYTYGKTLDELSDIFAAIAGASGPTDPTNPRIDYGPSNFDHRQSFVMNGVWESKWKPNNLLLGGWEMTGIFSRYTGDPISLVDTASSNDPNHDGRFDNRPQLKSGRTIGSAKTGMHIDYANGTIGYLDPTAFTAVNCGSALWCESPMSRGTYSGPSSLGLDMGFLKAFKVTESTRFRYEANFFNILNHPNFSNPSGTVNSGSFGTISSTGDPRVTQMALRFEF